MVEYLPRPSTTTFGDGPWEDCSLKIMVLVYNEKVVVGVEVEEEVVTIVQ